MFDEKVSRMKKSSLEVLTELRGKDISSMSVMEKARYGNKLSNLAKDMNEYKFVNDADLHLMIELVWKAKMSLSGISEAEEAGNTSPYKLGG